LVRSDVRQVRWGSEQWQAGAHARLEAGTKRWSSRRMESCGMFASLVRRSSSQPLGHRMPEPKPEQVWRDATGGGSRGKVARR
jgi:hypothetical protein